jgi:hypothetical protein
MLSLSTSAITASSVINANAGLTMGSNQNITLASTFTTPTAGQLGYTISTNGSTTGLITNGNTGSMNSSAPFSLTAGVWSITYGINSLTASTSTTWNTTYFKFALSNLTNTLSGITSYTPEDSSTRSYPVSGVLSVQQNYIATFTATTNVYVNYSIIASTGLNGGYNIRATRIA